MTNNNIARITAQVACEGIANAPESDWDLTALKAVLAFSLEQGVGEIYIDMVVEVIKAEEAKL